jgi:hypothetical protein
MSAHTTVRVDGKPHLSDDPETVFPRHDSLFGYGLVGTSTFAWMSEVAPGNHTIEIFFRPEFGGTGAFVKARTLTIEVYRMSR